jgi:hypothetical protein
MRNVTLAVVPLFAGLLFAQSQNRTETRTTTTTTTWNGALVDAACQSTRTERTESNVGGVRTNTQITTESNNCPVTATTTTFGLLTQDGRYIRFDNPSNARVVEIVRSRGFIPSDRGPLWVNVSGTSSGDVAIVETLDRSGSTVTVAQTERVDTDVIFDVTHDGDRGKLVVSPNRVSFEDISNSSHSRSWAYNEIKEFKRDGRQIKIEGHHGGSHDFKTEDRAMSDAVYNTIANRIVAARGR